MPASPTPPTLPPEINRHIISSNKKITSYIRCGDFDSALLVFRSMKVRTTVSWNSILAGYSSKPGKLREAHQLFDEIAEPDNVSYNLMLGCNFRNGNAVAAKDFFDKIPVRDTTSWNTMISGLSWNGMMDEARELFAVMPRRNVVSWNAMISGYVESGDMKSALELFVEAPEKGAVAWTSIITGYMRNGKVELAERTYIPWNAGQEFGDMECNDLRLCREWYRGGCFVKLLKNDGVGD